MWYFSWILGLGLALTFGILNAVWFEILECMRESEAHPLPVDPERKAKPGSPS